MGDRDLTPRQVAILMAVAEDEGANQTELAERTAGVDRSTLADLVRRMQRKRLLQRHRKKGDASASRSNLQMRDAELLRTAEPLAKRVDERVLRALPNKQRDQFMGALVSIVDTLQELSSRGTGVVRGARKRSA